MGANGWKNTLKLETGLASIASEVSLPLNVRGGGHGGGLQHEEHDHGEYEMEGSIHTYESQSENYENMNPVYALAKRLSENQGYAPANNSDYSPAQESYAA